MILLDTHIWVRWVDPSISPLPPAIVERIETADRLAVSAATCWKLAWLARRGRLEAQIGPGELDLVKWLNV